jgi:hypothetical protein
MRRKKSMDGRDHKVVTIVEDLGRCLSFLFSFSEIPLMARGTLSFLLATFIALMSISIRVFRGLATKHRIIVESVAHQSIVCESQSLAVQRIRDKEEV